MNNEWVEGCVLGNGREYVVLTPEEAEILHQTMAAFRQRRRVHPNLVSPPVEIDNLRDGINDALGCLQSGRPDLDALHDTLLYTLDWADHPDYGRH